MPGRSRCSSATKPLVSFDPKLLTAFEVTSGDSVVLTPNGAPQPTKIALPKGKLEIGELKSSVVTQLQLPLVFLIYRLYGIRRVLMTQTSSSTALNHRHNRRLGRMLNAVLVAWGAAVLALHSHASLVVWTQRDPGCLLDMQPWAQTSYTRTLQSLVVSNCPALEVPVSIPGDAFHNLIMLKLFNTTVARWGADAALNAARFPTLQQLLIVGTNLTMLPMELATVWRGVSFLTLERNPQLKAVPPVVGKLKSLVYLSLHHNAVQSSGFPSSILAEAALFQLVLSHNAALSVLPDSIGRWPSFRMLDISYTNVSSLPETWVSMKNARNSSSWDPGEMILVQAPGTPLCARAWPRPAIVQGWFVVRCSGIANNMDYTYPIDKERRWRQANRE
ncbi:hypothetical protein P43SY_012100 [Pythium insidiosum]|uniref:TKL protein kinase n=1 Tax=Pythium insidiosum TaxID=114742 RepID=A0AAD5Q1I0_PYTIN|nr:hypothetical protein P43SY_012100 [Pythium insidiosum]